MKEIETYLENTGQTFQELMGGGIAFGSSFIEGLVHQCLLEKKKIIWIDESDKVGLDAMS